MTGGAAWWRVWERRGGGGRPRRDSGSGSSGSWAPPGSGTSRPSAAQSLPPGSTLLLYTDGLIEIPGSDLDTGLARLRRHALALAHEPLDTLCDRLPARMPPGSTDDVALLALRLPSP
ncbi:Stage II sporulation protein E (SpoIIE) [Streptomyces sp. Go-475]|nr:Stage II sporulation protein E (SpoIIE) [Streptomyces sp. Go-475]